jgi:hypothetical protein
MRIYGAVCLFWILMGSAAPAQEWALDMFHRQTTHNFGTVARGAKVEYAFVAENIYKEDAHIASATSSCGCTRPSVVNGFFRTGQKAAVLCSIDTKSFLGHREAAVTVRFDRPFPAEVILHVSVFIRGDVVVQPGEIDFGSVSQGARSTRRVTISYAGLPNWEIATIETSNRFLDIRAIESSRTAEGVTYDLSVSLKEAMPIGYLKDQLILVTNDANPFNSRVPVPLEGIIVPTINVRPSPLLMGVANAGQSVTKTLVVQGHVPFRVVSVRCSDPRFQFRKPDAAGSLQLIPVTFAADNVAGTVQQIIHIETDNSAKPAMDVPVQVRVMPSAMVKAEINGSLLQDEPKIVSEPKTAPATAPLAVPGSVEDKPLAPAAKEPAPVTVKSVPAAENGDPAPQATATERDSSGPELAAPGQPRQKPGLQVPWSNLLSTPDGAAASPAARDPASAETPPSPSPSTTIPTAVAPPAAAPPVVAPPAKTQPAPGPAVSKLSASVASPPPAPRKSNPESMPLQRPMHAPDGKPASKRTVHPGADSPSDGPVPPRPPLPWDTPPPAKPIPKAAPQQN